jgi:hypothetical protein
MVTGLHSARFLCADYIKEYMVYECKINPRNEVLNRIADNEGHMDNPDVPLQVLITLNLKYPQVHTLRDSDQGS